MNSKSSKMEGKKNGEKDGVGKMPRDFSFHSLVIESFESASAKVCP